MKKQMYNVEKAEKEWLIGKLVFDLAIRRQNIEIDIFKQKYRASHLQSIEMYCKAILIKSEYPFKFSKSVDIFYSPDTKILIVEYLLPKLEQIPNVKDVKYIARDYKNKIIYLTENQHNKLYETTLYRMTLRSLHELFFNDDIDAVDAISFNGWTTTINKTNGHDETNCILSVYVTKQAFNSINLASVDPKQCFKALKGVSAANLHTHSPVQPIISYDKNDKRLVESKDITVNEGTNLAAMNWEDFEHLVRELFEMEFSHNGGEVKVTQASRDGGVDAIAFDPDPIRGGKIVIQAKRYTNTVGVSAVRDLYGTVINEGATKGILITTADYGHDSYEFAKGKPLTLLNGGHLLFLLQKHGRKAYIDIEQAKSLLML